MISPSALHQARDPGGETAVLVAAYSSSARYLSQHCLAERAARG
ncbi:MAG: hypothetical protein ACFCUT_02300 [Kiloniellaceae bacterium]